MWLIFLLCATTCACRYTTKVSKEKKVGCFQEQIRLPHGEALDIIGVNTGSLQVGTCLQNTHDLNLLIIIVQIEFLYV